MKYSGTGKFQQLWHVHHRHHRHHWHHRHHGHHWHHRRAFRCCPPLLLAALCRNEPSCAKLRPTICCHFCSFQSLILCSMLLLYMHAPVPVLLQKPCISVHMCAHVRVLLRTTPCMATCTYTNARFADHRWHVHVPHNHHWHHSHHRHHWYGLLSPPFCGLTN